MEASTGDVVTSAPDLVSDRREEYAFQDLLVVEW